ncbi:MAG TPA: DNA mismatch repair endonuclease MutL [Patescibacteria group bacterium]|nr:DNA mismatch repair endonuclease MutL [Patescibacteria group bacterium]
MKTIHQLSPFLISKIAAGEVIERPSFAVKELIENAIDAKATDIHIFLEEGGLKKIQVSDNGIGMSEEDIQESWKPHTTSKIGEEDALTHISSLGFRGEALASLSSVSRLTIKSKTAKDKIGTQIIVEQGKLLEISPVGMAVGTTVISENLFAFVPARKKFLKSSQTELRHTIDLVGNFSVAYPSLHFTLVHGKKTLLDLPATKNVFERIEELLGEETTSFFMPIKSEESYVSLSGFIAKPQKNSTTQSKQMIFVNKRKVSDRLISLAVKEAFGTMLEPTAYPLFVLFLSLSLEMVDVNVHPRKEQVAFINSEFIFQTIKSAVSSLLSENNLTFQNLSWKKRGVGTTNSFAANLLRETVLEKETLTVSKQTQLLQIHKLYIAAQTDTGMLVIDQHAAHERVLFEKLKKQFLLEKEMKKVYVLSSPVGLSLSKTEQQLFKEYVPFLNDIGFGFQKNNIIHVPFLFADRSPKEFLLQLFERLEQGLPLDSLDAVSEEMLAFLACRAAVKAGDSLTQEQMHEILEKLETTDNNSTCPHGRPTKMFISLSQLHQMFKRE